MNLNDLLFERKMRKIFKKSGCDIKNLNAVDELVGFTSLLSVYPPFPSSYSKYLFQTDIAKIDMIIYSSLIIQYCSSKYNYIKNNKELFIKNYVSHILQYMRNDSSNKYADMISDIYKDRFQIYSSVMKLESEDSEKPYKNMTYIFKLVLYIDRKNVFIPISKTPAPEQVDKDIYYITKLADSYTETLIDACKKQLEKIDFIYYLTDATLNEDFDEEIINNYLKKRKEQ